MAGKENSLLKDKHILICSDIPEQSIISQTEIDFLKTNFCGVVLNSLESTNQISPDSIVYLCGYVQKIYDGIKHIPSKSMYVIKELSDSYDEFCTEYKFVSMGQVPINIHGVGVYFRQIFDSDKNYFDLIKSEHEFQTLTESNKPSNALRKGIYLTKVEQSGQELKYYLLRCSSNLNGPSDNFRSTDEEIISQVNSISELFFEEKVEFNHVLAQIYENADGKKAKIKAHSDKTKDMPANALIAFCTFYDKSKVNPKVKQSTTDMFDYTYNNKMSVLTKLRFRLKKTVFDENLVKEFSITLYPNSVFLIPLSTNRLYTHEIVPSGNPAHIIPIRMGYVVRCSNTPAIYLDGKTYIYENGVRIELQPINDEDADALRSTYFEENSTDKNIVYDRVNFSMNNGDYSQPLI